ncbi:reverse transcriptase family protein [Caulobacter sp.]|uniref:reverse transcriptase family protein n=1 Tax=Caulobacter sp. TaxID=78 RepID=UPI003BACE5F2
MRLPHHLVNSLFFTFETVEEFITALGIDADSADGREILRLSELGLPPITSQTALATMIGINPGLVWSLQNRTRKYYREFSIPKGKSRRHIQAPKIALKIIQKWLSIHLQNRFSAPNHVFGFVNGKSHIDAAKQHLGANWIISLDIKDFFQTTPQKLVEISLISMGYNEESASLISSISCLNGYLAQGSPCSPVLSNICFQEIDAQLIALTKGYDARISRYADDVVISGCGDIPDDIKENASKIIQSSVWNISHEKTLLSKSPDRLKVHGLLVHGDNIRLTKGYRNRIRAIRHLVSIGRIPKEAENRALGHLNYSNQVDLAAKK